MATVETTAPVVAAPAGGLAGQVRRPRPHLGVELPPHEGRPRGARPGPDRRAADPHRGARPARRCLLVRGGRLPASRGCGRHLRRVRLLPLGPAVHPVRGLGDAGGLGPRGHRQRDDADRDRARDARDPAGRAGDRPTAHRRGGRVRRGRDDHAAVDVRTGRTSSGSPWRSRVGRATGSGGPTTGASSPTPTSAVCRSRRPRSSVGSRSWCRSSSAWSMLQPRGLSALWAYRLAGHGCP